MYLPFVTIVLAFLEFHVNGVTQHILLCIWLISLSILFWDSSVLLHASCIFLLLSIVLWYGCSTVYLLTSWGRFKLLLVLLLLWIMLLWAFACTFLCDLSFYSPWINIQTCKLLVHSGNVWDFPRWSYHFSFPWATCENSGCSESSSVLDVISHCNFSRSSRSVVVFH